MLRTRTIRNGVLALFVLAFSLALSAAEKPIRVTFSQAADVKVFAIFADKSYRSGQLRAGGVSYDLYLPIRNQYSTVNTSEDVLYRYDCTPVVVDSDHNRELGQSEYWLTCWPIRLGNEMFAVKQIDSKGKWVDFVKLDAPLTGLSIGGPTPEFSFTTTEGNTVSNETYQGKYLLLDVWSMT